MQTCADCKTQINSIGVEPHDGLALIGDLDRSLPVRRNSYRCSQCGCALTHEHDVPSKRSVWALDPLL